MRPSPLLADAIVLAELRAARDAVEVGHLLAGLNRGGLLGRGEPLEEAVRRALRRLEAGGQVHLAEDSDGEWVARLISDFEGRP